MGKVTVVAKVTVKAEGLERVREELVKMLAPTRAEKGCIEYRLHQDNDNPRVFMFYESWENMGCLESHMNSPHFKNYVAAVADLLEDKVVHKLTEV
ncbi:antibiotic biosynthesis monooxygenase [Geomonas sp. Red32]|uniref:putative quinol monooxygenase n=1 Tax=Geomonas sp. Red32 TaxID=2912856 RepID=UPI00202CCDAB|nr:putative quinol monooxygenase [Geomonas sp. Red32]MCM0082961.1 antibiotic biosynthesis monooxygenase [Geomonas sp. Red32]